MWYHHYHFFPWGLSGGMLLFLLVPYFLPTIIAMLRGKSSVLGIFLLNFFLGFTVIGWIGALIWSLSADRRTTIIYNNTTTTPPPPPPPPTSHTYTNVTIRRPGTTQQDKLDQLRQLKQLRDEGVLTEAEFNRQKAEILG